MHRILFFSLILVSTTLFGGISNVDSVNLQYSHINYSTIDGLPSNEIYCVQQDKKGYLWFGTDRGLVKFNGYDFETFTTHDGLLNNGIVGLFEDSIGRLWYSTLNAQIGYKEKESNIFFEFDKQNLIDSVLESNDKPEVHFNDISFDENGDLFLVHNSAGYLVIKKNGQSSCKLKGNNLIQLEINNLNGFKVFVLPCNKNLDIDLELLFNDSIIYQKTELGYYNYSYPKLVDNKSVLHIYDKNRYYKISKSGEFLEEVKLKDWTQGFKIDNRFIINEYTNKRGSVFLSESPLMNKSSIKLLDDEFITGVLKDNKNGIWISTLSSGIYYFSDLNHVSSISTFEVNGIIPIVNDRISINIEGLVNLEYNLKTNSISKAENLNFEDINFDKIHNRHLNVFSKVKINDLKPIDRRNPIKVKNFGVYGVQKHSDLYYSFWVPKFIFDNNEINLTVRHDYGNGLKRIESFYQISDSLSLIGTHSGLYKIINNEQYKIELGNNFRDKPRVDNIIHLPNYNKTVCSVLGNGILVLDENFNILYNLTTEDGLISNTINHLSVDEDNNIWVSTNKGVSKVFIENDTFNVQNVLASSKLLKSPNIRQIYKQDSLLFVGSDRGFSIINIDQWEASRESSRIPIYIGNIEISNASKSNISHNNLKYNQNNIEINYEAIAFNLFGKIKFRYKLEGLFSNWNYSSDTKVVFSQLQPGNYSFVIEAQNEFGDWIKCKNSPSFIINKPFWSEWWFILISFLFLILIFAGGFWYYIQNLKNEKVLILERKKLSEDLLLSKQKSLNSQLNPHFVFNSLNSIQNFILTQKTELSSDYLSMFSKLMRYVFENSKKLYIPLSDEIKALSHYFKLEQVRHNHIFDFYLNYDGLDIESINIPSLLVQPIIENAIWHGVLNLNSRSGGFIEVYFIKKENFLRIEVIDNGVGRKRTENNKKVKVVKNQKSSGIQLTKERLKLLQESTSLDTFFEIEDLFDSKGNSNGTRVVIQIPSNL